MKILILGGSHGIGLELARQALEEGHHVTILARHPEKVGFRHDHLTIQKGDSTRPEDVERAVADQDAVVSTLGTKPTRKPVKLFSESARNTVEALRKRGRKPLIHVTGIGTGDSRGHGGFLYDRIVQPLLLKTTYEDKEREEEILRKSGLDWTVVRPGFLTNGPRTGKFKVVTDMRGVKAGKISRADVAGFILGQLKTPAYRGQAPLVTY